jgi:hypothetical protein
MNPGLRRLRPHLLIIYSGDNELALGVTAQSLDIADMLRTWPAKLRQNLTLRSARTPWSLVFDPAWPW